MSSDDSSTLCVSAVVRRVVEHEFHAIENGFTVEPETGCDGVSDLSNPDWHVRTLAVRDLVRLGRDATSAIVTMLKHGNPHVRQVGAMVLGILRAESASELLGRVLHQDPDQVVRAHAAIALGEIGVPRESLSRGAEADESGDVRHQCAVALDRIQKGQVIEPQVAERFAALEVSTFRRARPGELTPDFALEDTEGRSWRLSDFRGKKTVVLIWIFADWCPVCHNEFHELIEYKDRFRDRGIEVATLECHDRYRCRVMLGKEGKQSYWFADEFPGATPQDRYCDEVWWPHLVDRAAAVGLQYGIDPWQYTVHSEWINRPSTVIVDPTGIVRLAYFGRYWGDRPSIVQTLEMIETGRYEFEAPPMRRGPH